MGLDPVQQKAAEWHVSHWPPLAWVETGIKAAALVIGIFVLFVSLSERSFVMPRGLELAQFWVRTPNMKR